MSWLKDADLIRPEVKRQIAKLPENLIDAVYLQGRADEQALQRKLDQERRQLWVKAMKSGCRLKFLGI